MAISNAVFKLAVDTDPAPLAVAEMMNRALVGTGGPRAFLTLFYALLDPASGTGRLRLRGPPLPPAAPQGGEIVKLGSGSFPLGLRPRLELTAADDEIRPGDLLLLYTDGIPEALDEQGEAFGFDRLQRSLQHAGPPQEVHDRIVAEVERFEDRGEHDDDRSLVVIARSAFSDP